MYNVLCCLQCVVVVYYVLYNTLPLRFLHYAVVTFLCVFAVAPAAAIFEARYDFLYDLLLFIWPMASLLLYHQAEGCEKYEGKPCNLDGESNACGPYQIHYDYYKDCNSPGSGDTHMYVWWVGCWVGW